MSTFFDEMRDLAAELMADASAGGFGRSDMTLLVVTEGAPLDASMPWRVAPGVVVEVPFVGVGPIPDSQAARNDSTVSYKEGTVLIPRTLSPKPIPNKHRLDINGVQYTILDYNDYDLDGTSIFMAARVKAWTMSIGQPSQGIAP